MEKALKERHARRLFVKFFGQKFPETVEEIMVSHLISISLHSNVDYIAFRRST